MTLKLYGHPLSSFVQKVKMALYESRLSFDFAMVEFDDPKGREAFLALSPMGKIPALRDEAAGRTLSETSIILEHLAITRTEAAWLLPPDPVAALEVRARDRFFDLYLQQPMQKVVLDRLRPANARDGLGVRLARLDLSRALDLVEAAMANRRFSVGDELTMADCAAAPALHYANKVIPFEASHPAAAAYYRRLAERPSYARCLQEAEPYLHLHPEEPAEA